MKRPVLGLLAVLVLALAATTSAWANHGPLTGHLPPSNANVDLVGKLKVSDVVPGWVTDIATYRDTAYLGAWNTRCGETPSVSGGFWVIDIKDPTNPRELKFVSAPPGTYQTEGLHAFRMTTPAFTGDVLAVSNETCDDGGQGGISLYDVTNPANPVPLKIGFGDTQDTAPFAHDSHSVFAWDAGDKAYAVFVDNFEQGTGDVDIADITDPRNPVLISEKGLDDWPAAQDNLAFGGSPNNHDMIVRRVEGHWLLLISYWDAGYVVVNVDNPANPIYVKDSDFPTTDPLTGFSPPEGNAHEAEWDRCPEEGVRSNFPCGDVRYILGADEDFSAYRLTDFRMTTGPNAGVFQGGEFGFTPTMATNYPDGIMQGPTVWGGTGCPDLDSDGDGISDRAEVPAAASIATPLGAGETKIIVFTRGTCFFSEKIESGQLAGYNAVAIGNSHAATAGGANPDGAFCGGQGHEYTKTASAVCIGHRMMHLLFNDPPAYTGANGADMPALGTVGQKIRARSEFDGFGYLNLINADTMQHIDAYTVPQALDPRFAQGFGDLTIHEVTTDPTGDVGYLAWYSAGFRVVDYSGGDLQEVGHYIDEKGNDIWGVELNVRKDGRIFALGSDRDYGLYIYRFGTDLRPVKASSPRTTRVGNTISYRLRVANSGTIAETNTVLTDRLPRGVRFVSASATQGSCGYRAATRTVTCNFGRLIEDAGSAFATITVRAMRRGVIRNVAMVNGRKTEYDIGNNKAATTTRVRGAIVGPALTGRP